MMKKTNECYCGTKIYTNQKLCSKCRDVLLFGGEAQARQAHKESLELLFRKKIEKGIIF